MHMWRDAVAAARYMCVHCKEVFTALSVLQPRHHAMDLRNTQLLGVLHQTKQKLVCCTGTANWQMSYVVACAWVTSCQVTIVHCYDPLVVPNEAKFVELGGASWRALRQSSSVQ
jgi:hypothetical protein